jgi:Voltage-dependent anion channel
VLAATLLLALSVATAVHWLRHPEIAGGHHRDPAIAPFYGAPPMAMLAVGAGALLVGRDLIGLPLRSPSMRSSGRWEGSPAWWSFTFPVGTLVTGTSELALHTHADFLTWTSDAFYALLVAAWLTAEHEPRTDHSTAGCSYPPQLQNSAPPRRRANRLRVATPALARQPGRRASAW